ncbi:DUF4247 domain-containing protein [Halobacillus sp. Marseille-Q1614]|uniref:DUF4247 domain-containing protein n=1 Tax=Halobacillus sp. Marseille-Q1614 TaxID=2709134 RepID=UPI00156EE555|nr:DUF4247 domain-containing protein [Halobacillus sp. Marseille-Q1614]
MKDYIGLFIVITIAIVVGYQSFADSGTPRGMSGSNTIDTYGELPDEPSKSEVLQQIRDSEAESIRDLIDDGFPLLDTVESDRGIAEIYMTQELTLKETADEIAGKLEPEEISERQDKKQVLIYPDDFVILQESDEEPGLILIELASDQFVRNNYSPSFFQGLLAYSLLNRMLGSNDWAQRRASNCEAGGCYGGYSMYGGYNSNSTGTLRGSSNRGGGPGTGK